MSKGRIGCGRTTEPGDDEAAAAVKSTGEAAGELGGATDSTVWESGSTKSGFPEPSRLRDRSSSILEQLESNT